MIIEEPTSKLILQRVTIALIHNFAFQARGTGTTCAGEYSTGIRKHAVGGGRVRPGPSILFVPQLLLLLLLSFPFIIASCIIPSAPGLQIPVPTGRQYLPFQLHSIESLWRSDRILLADQMGLGKTITVIGALNMLKIASNSSQTERVLIVCPKSVIPSWQWELRNWLVEDAADQWTVGVATAERGLPEHRTKILLMNYDIVDKFRCKLDVDWGPFDVIVCDEAHFLKSSDAIRTQAILGSLGGYSSNGKQKRDKRYRHGLTTRRLWLLTGSPLLNNPSELYTLLRSIDQDCQVIPELRSLEDFCGRYSKKREAPWGTTYRGGRNLPELRQRLKTVRTDDGNSGTPLMIRRTKAQVLKDLPPKRHQLLPLWDDENRIATEERERVERALQQLTAGIENRSSSCQPVKTIETGWDKMTVVELKAVLKDNNLKVSGTKQQLIERLHENNVVVAVKEEIPRESTIDQDSDTLSAPIEGELDVYSLAESALRSQRRFGKSSGGSVVQELLGRLRSKGVNTTKKDIDSIRGLLALARHETARMKVPHAIELIENAIESHKVLAFAHHRDVQTELRVAFGARAVGITGGDSLEERCKAVERFQNDPSVRLFVGSIKAAGTGITLNAASHVIFVELDWSPLVVQQAEDRCHRVGQTSSVLVQYLFFPDTIDEYLSELLASKQSTINAAIDEPTGAASWIFDFGKHMGLCIGDVAGCDPSYLEWLAETSTVLTRKPKLALALKELGFISSDASTRNERNPPVTEKDMREKTPSDMHHEVLNEMNFKSPSKKMEGIRSKPGNYVMTFGKHKGKRLADVPTGYLQWLRLSGATRRNPSMAMCLNKHLAERKK